MKAIVKKVIAIPSHNNNDSIPAYHSPAENTELNYEEIMKEFSVYPPCLQSEPNEKVVHDPIVMNEASGYEENLSFSEKQRVMVADDSVVTLDDAECKKGFQNLRCVHHIVEHGVEKHKPEIINNILRKQHKMLLTGSSKAGKSFLLRSLGIAVASGTSWLGMKCEKGKVLYVDFELDTASFEERLDAALNDLSMTKSVEYDLFYVNLKDNIINLPTFINKVIETVEENIPDVSLIIIDPIYRMNFGDENSALDVNNLFNAFNFISEKTGAAIAYCHHHAKGSSNTKSVIDRASGSGAFARSADAIIDVSEYAAKEGKKILRVETVLREFESPDPYYILFEYPLHKVIDKETAEKFKGGSSARKSSSPKTSPEEYKNKILISFNKLRSPDGTCSISDLLKDTGIGSVNTVRKYLGECGLKSSNGKVSAA